MIPRECKRLAEVDFPIAEVSRHSAREKSIRHGHPSTLHLWWARRPLAACRAMLLALLLPDPGDPHCPERFKAGARAVLRAPLPQPKGKTDLDLRQALLKFIADFANWDASAESVFLEAARSLVKAAHGQEPPLVADPFAGGGSIPLEALRLGCDAFASDLNTVACLILKVLLEDIPRHGLALADQLRRVGAEIRAAAEKELAEFYPADPDGAHPIAYLWARTVRCESPGCGAEIPLLRSFWLCKKATRQRALRYEIKRPKGKPPEVELDIFEPKSHSDVPHGTVSRAKASCPACNIVLSPERVRAQLAAQGGGADVVLEESGRRTSGARLLAVVALKDDERGRRYRLPADSDYQAISKARQALEMRTREPLPGGLSWVPDEPLPPVGTLGFRVQRYGMLRWGDLFTARQKLAFVALVGLLRQIPPATTARAAAMVCTKLADRNNSLVNWSVGVECPNQLFKGNAVPMGWDFAESNPLSDSSASISQSVENISANILASVIPAASPSSPQIADARNHPLASGSAAVWFTDPPYYDAVPYADLSDFFFVWFKRALPGDSLLRDPFDSTNPLTPKECEVVQDETKTFKGRPKDRAFFEERMAEAFAEGARILGEGGVGTVVFAHKTTEGWEALLSGLIRGGWVITASWPITTERYSRFRARESAALSASVHLVCRPRDAASSIGDWGDVYEALPRRIAEWIERLTGEGIRGADLVFACIGPALELFSRCRQVELPDGEVVGLAATPSARGEPARRGFLSYVWEAVGRAALTQVLGSGSARAGDGGAGMLEEDARLTALFLWTIQSTALPENGQEDAADEEAEATDDENEASRPTVRAHGF